MTQTPNPIDIIAQNEETFRTIAEEAENPEVAEKYGRQPLRLLELHRERRS